MKDEMISAEQIESFDRLFDLDRRIESDEDLIVLAENLDEDE